METFPKLFLTGAIVLDMAMANYCYNTYGLSPDQFFKSVPVSAPVTLEQSTKVPFISNYVGSTYDNVVSSLAIIDDTVSSGALFGEYRESLDKKIYVGNVRVQVPGNKDSLGKGLELKTDINYAGDDDAGKIYIDGRAAAGVRIKKGMIYRISSTDEQLKIDGIGVGSTLLDVCQKWGPPAAAEDDRIFYFNVGTKAQITVITSWESYVTWILYEGLKTEILSDPKPEKENGSIIEKLPETAKEHTLPVSQAILDLHRERMKEGE